MENPYVKVRRENIEKMRELIEKEQPIKHKRLIGLMGMRGLREKTILSYLNVLQDGGFAEYDGKEGTWKIKGDKKK